MKLNMKCIKNSTKTLKSGLFKGFLNKKTSSPLLPGADANQKSADPGHDGSVDQSP